MKRSRKLFLIISVFCIALALTSCQSKDSDEDFSESYDDVEYLMTDYVDQLVRDGAETVTGTLEITGTEENYSVTVDEKKVVINDNYDDGYYIADRNITNTYPLGNDTGFVVMEDGNPVICTAEEFMEKHAGDTNSLYTVYLMGDTAEHIIPLDPQSLIEQTD